MKLNVAERLNILQLLPQEGNFITLKVVRELQSELSFSEEELKSYEIDEKENMVQWNQGGNDRKEITIGDTGMGIISDAFKKLEGENKLSLRLLSLYERIVEKKDLPKEE